MERVKAAVTGNVWVRVGVVAALATIISIPFAPFYWRVLLAATIIQIGSYWPAYLIGAIAGFVTWSRSVWWRTTLAIGLLMLFFQVYSILFLPAPR